MVGVLRGAVVPYLKGGIELIIEVVSVFVMALYLAGIPSIYVEGLVALVPPERRPLARVILYDLKVTFTLGWWDSSSPWSCWRADHARSLAPRDPLLPGVRRVCRRSPPSCRSSAPCSRPWFRRSSRSAYSGLGKAIAVAALGVGVHLIEANFVAPVVMERQVNLPPVITIAGVLLIGKLFGLAGLIVAVPILAFVMVLIRHILLGEVYGDPVSEVKPSGTVPPEAEPTIAPQPVTS